MVLASGGVEWGTVRPIGKNWDDDLSLLLFCERKGESVNGESTTTKNLFGEGVCVHTSPEFFRSIKQKVLQKEEVGRA